MKLFLIMTSIAIMGCAIGALADDDVTASYRILLGEANERIAQLNAQILKSNVEKKKLEDTCAKQSSQP